jgi:hypothetical protein
MYTTSLPQTSLLQSSHNFLTNPTAFCTVAEEPKKGTFSKKEVDHGSAPKCPRFVSVVNRKGTVVGGVEIS